MKIYKFVSLILVLTFSLAWGNGSFTSETANTSALRQGNKVIHNCRAPLKVPYRGWHVVGNSFLRPTAKAEKEKGTGPGSASEPSPRPARPAPQRVSQFTYLVLNKPPNHISQNQVDPRGRPNIYQLVPQKIVRSPNNPNGVVSVGRLDVDTTGIMLFTDDGALNNFMSTHGRKVYVAEVEGVMGDEAAKSLLEGVTIKIPDPHKGNKKYEVDYHTRADAVEVISRGVRRNVSQIRIVISEGKYHQIKSMLAAVGHPVLNLTRTQFGPLRLGNLGPGEWRYLTAEEIRVLLAMRHNEEYKAARFAANISVLRPRAAGDRLKFGNGDTLQFKFANGTTMHNYADDSFASCRQV